MTVCELLTGKIRLACASWAMVSVCTWAAPIPFWNQTPAAALGHGFRRGFCYTPLPSGQITLSLWTSDSALTTGFGSPDVANALNAIPGVLMETRGLGGSRD